MEIETIETYRYKTEDGKSFDDKKEAIEHERRVILQEIFTHYVVPDQTRTAIIGAIINKFDEIYDKFSLAEVLIED